MTNPSTPELQARALLTDAFRISDRIHDAIRNLDEARAGYPTRTLGSSASTVGFCDEPGCGNQAPCRQHDSPSSSTERNAMTPDVAAKNLADLHACLRQATNFAHKVGKIIAAATSQRQTVADLDIYCRNCISHGIKNTREEDKTECSFCGDIRRATKEIFGRERNAPRALIELHERKRVYEGDIRRIFARLDEEAALVKGAAKGARRADKAG